MFRFLCVRAGTEFPIHLTFLQNKIVYLRLLSSSLHVKKTSVKDKENEKERSFMVEYLMNSCELSLESAISASKTYNLKNTERAESVLRLLRDHGFTNTQISNIIRIYPGVISYNPERIILPKIQFFRSIGLSRKDLPHLISQRPTLLNTSLQNRLVPNYNCLKNVLGSDEKVVRALKANYRLFLLDIEHNLTSNIAFLRKSGVPDSRIPLLLIWCPAAAIYRHSKFCKIVEKVKEMGFNPAHLTFITAIKTISQLKKSVWESKFEIYRRWGWSRDETIAAFRRHPHCLLSSEEKITKAMDFLVNKMGWFSQLIAKIPVVLLLSLKKRIVPRCYVVQVLLSKGLIRESICPTTFLLPREEVFLEKYVTKFQEKVPELLNVYQGKVHYLDVKPGCQGIVK